MIFKKIAGLIGALALVALLCLFIRDPIIARLINSMGGDFYHHLFQARFLFGILTMTCAATWIFLVPRRNERIIGGIFLTLAFGLVLKAKFGFPREMSAPRNQCINNLRQIDGAIQIWALDHGRTNGSLVIVSSMATNIKFGFPRCPLGGIYKIGKVGESPTCTVPGHTL